MVDEFKSRAVRSVSSGGKEDDGRRQIWRLRGKMALAASSAFPVADSDDQTEGNR